MEWSQKSHTLENACVGSVPLKGVAEWVTSEAGVGQFFQWECLLHAPCKCFHCAFVCFDCLCCSRNGWKSIGDCGSPCPRARASQCLYSAKKFFQLLLSDDLAEAFSDLKLWLRTAKLGPKIFFASPVGPPNTNLHCDPRQQSFLCVCVCSSQRPLWWRCTHTHTKKPTTTKQQQ